MNRSNCSVDGCDRPHAARGWCNAHYERMRDHGDVYAHQPFRYGRPLAECQCRRCWVNPWVHRAPRCPRGHGPDLVLLYTAHNGVEWWNCIESGCSGKRFVAREAVVA